MLVYDWLWWGQLTYQNRVRRCTEVRGGAQRCVEGCAEVRRGVCGGAQRGARRCAEVRGGVNEPHPQS